MKPQLSVMHVMRRIVVCNANPYLKRGQFSGLVKTIQFPPSVGERRAREYYLSYTTLRESFGPFTRPMDEFSGDRCSGIDECHRCVDRKSWRSTIILDVTRHLEVKLLGIWLVKGRPWFLCWTNLGASKPWPLSGYHDIKLTPHDTPLHCGSACIHDSGNGDDDGR
jgi:hypothetical protein